ncbi:MAG: DUF6443 domain-containing protein [Chitinophagaceae bacterium]|jgi:RHS repeat-associated protein|nr:DUF6443 domain-containing protein [Chitinophagaceae bacterium]
MNRLLQKNKPSLKPGAFSGSHRHWAFSLVLFVLSIQLAKAQNISLNNYGGESQITTSNGSIILTSGFHVAAGQTTHIYITGTPNPPPGFVNPSLPNVTTAFSATQNYIAAWTATAPDTGVSHLIARPVKDAKLSVQYFDGLGRPLQTVIKQGSLETATGNSGDIVTPIVYDAFGREATKYLPYIATGTGNSDGSYKSAATTQQTSFYNTTNILTGQGETGVNAKDSILYEASPLNRVLKSMAPGSSWVGAGVGVQQGYWTNTPTDSVRYWTVSFVATLGNGFGSFTQPTAYQSGQLYKNVTTDENNHQVIEFKDKEGHTVLKKVQNTAVTDAGTGSGHTGWLCTYYLYDDLGNLRGVIQPKGVQLLQGNSWNLADSTILKEQCFRYEYDQRNRMIMKQVPGAQPVYMVYNTKDLLVMTQDGNMRTANNWLVTQYDTLNRPIKTGLLNSSIAFTAQLSNAYDSTNYPGSIGNQLTETHYDDYKNLPALSGSYLNTWDSQFDATNNSTYPYPQKPAQNSAITTQGLVTWTKTAVLTASPSGGVGGGGTFLTTVNIYDDKGRVIQTQSQNYNGGTDVATTQYTWAGQPYITVQKTANAKVSGGDSVLVVVGKITYDDLGRVVKTEKKQSSTKVNGGAMTAYATIATMQYDALGQLKKKILDPSYVGGANEGLENLNYDYNIRGWLLGVNRAYVKDAGSTNTSNSPLGAGISGESFTDVGASAYSYGTNFFGFDLGYDKTNNNLINNQSYAAKQLNGNIAGMMWKSNTDGVVRKYDFTYDAVNRLTVANFGQYNGSSFTNSAVNYTTNNLTYDANGNILTMNQYGLKSTGTSAIIDQLTYTYQSSGNSNKLLNVVDAANDATSTLGDFHYTGTKTATATDYVYDANGNLISDANKNISKIYYNILNLPDSIIVTNKGYIKYLYDAAGVKLQKKTVEGTKTTTTTYIGGVVYRQSSLNTTQASDTLQFIAHEEGRLRVSNNVWVSDYFLKDHLGNTRMVLTDDNSVSSPILEATSYYPFGLQQKGISLTAATQNLQNKYLYNGNEIQHQEFSDGSGLETMDFNARMYDPQLGRFWQQDPMQEYMRRWSSYAFAFDNPILFKDPTGLVGDTTKSKVTPPQFGGSAPNIDPNNPSYLPPVTVVGKIKKSTARKVAEWIPVIGFGLDSYDAFKGGHWIKGSLFALAAIGDALTLGEEGVIAHAGEEVVEHAVEDGVVHAEEEVAERAVQETEEIIGKETTEQTGKEEATKDISTSKNEIPKGSKETKEFGRMHGQKVYKQGNRYYSKDVDGHKGGVWKVFEKVGGKLKRIGTAGKDGNIFSK